MNLKPHVEFSFFAALDIRVGQVINVEDAVTRKPTYRLTIDFGPTVGVKVSCGAYRKYSKEELLGRQVIAVINFPGKRMGPELSEALILGVTDANGDTVYLAPQRDVALGAEVF